MKTNLTTLAGIALAALGLSGGRANAFQPGEYDDEAVRLLRAMAQAIPLRTTSLQKIAPAFVVEKQAGLTWDEAVAEADRRFGQRQPERAAFLRKDLGKGSPESHLDQLHLRLRNSGGISGFTSKEFAFEPRDKPTATILVSVGQRQLLDEPTLRLPRATIEGVVYTHLVFDLTDHLIAAGRELVSTRGATLTAGQNTTGGAGENWFSVQVSTPDGGSEALTFTSDIVIKERRVFLPKDLTTPKFVEVYENGILRKRTHYNQRTGEAHFYKEKEETFP